MWKFSENNSSEEFVSKRQILGRGEDEACTREASPLVLMIVVRTLYLCVIVKCIIIFF